MKKISSAVLLCCVAIQGMAWAALREEWIDEKGDGKKNAHLFYDGQTIVKSEVDKGGDSRPDLFLTFKDGKRHQGQESRACNGIIDRWYFYNAQGLLLQRQVDKNGDGKPDEFTSFYNGQRQAVTKENDRNFDGKIDKRLLQSWDDKKTITVPDRNQMRRIPMPGYKTIWKELDDNYDGVIDAYRNRLDKKKTKVGERMDPEPMRVVDTESHEAPDQAKVSGPQKSQTESLVDRMNEKYGIK